jgi:predicted nucleotidyltransferase
MPDENQRRIDLADRIGEIYRNRGEARAMLLTGSVARGEADESSDIDFSIYYDELPPLERLKEVRTLVGGSEYVMFFGSHEEGGIVESYHIDGIRHDFAHTSIAEWEKNMDTVLVDHAVDSPMQKAISGILDGRALFGHEHIARWKERAADYPDALAEAMVRHHMKFRPASVIDRYAARRDDTLFLHELYIETINKVLGTMLGLNRIYHWGEYKRIDSFIGAMRVAPDDLAGRIRRVLRGEQDASLGELDLLVMETFDLIDRHMPHIDTSERRERYLLPFSP